MKQRKYSTIFGLIVALTGLSPVMAEDAGRTSDGMRIQPDQRQYEGPLRNKLSPEQMDNIHAGRRMEDDLKALSDFRAKYCENMLCHVQVSVAEAATIQSYANGCCK